jgi:hypothetical protein
MWEPKVGNVHTTPQEYSYCIDILLRGPHCNVWVSI